MFKTRDVGGSGHTQGPGGDSRHSDGEGGGLVDTFDCNLLE